MGRSIGERADGALAAPAALYVELLLAIHSEQALVVHYVPLTSEQHVQAPITTAKPRPSRGD